MAITLEFVARTKALSDEDNATLQSLVRSVLDGHFPGRGGQTRFEEAEGLSQAHISTMLKHGRGGGVHSLRALAKYRPVEVVRMLGIKLETLVGLWTKENPKGAVMAGLPDELRRAARAAVELWGYLPDEAHRAALDALGEPRDGVKEPSEFEWLTLLRPHLPKRSQSGTRRRL